MTVRIATRSVSRERRHYRIRKQVHGTSERPRLSVFKSIRHMYVQVIDDSKGHTIASASTYEKEVGGQGTSRSLDSAEKVGTLIAERAKSCGVTQVVFDRGGYRYHGYVKAVADAARKAGLEF